MLKQQLVKHKETDISHLFGTDGIRTRVGSFPFTTHHLIVLGKAIGIWMHEFYGKPVNLLIGQDTRLSGPLVKASLKAGLLQNAIHLYDADILPTPVMAALLKYYDLFDGGIMITASHNQYQDNGLKIIAKQGQKINKQQEEQITNHFYRLLAEPAADCFSTSPMSDKPWSHTYHYYLTILEKFFAPNFLHTINLIIDCAHGASYALAPLIFTHFGAHVITLNNQPTGVNINDQCGSMYPAQLTQAMHQHQADIGFAFDGDGDRLIVVNKQGTIFDGDAMLALLHQHPVYHHQKTIVGTAMTNEGLIAYLHAKHSNLVRARVGDVQVLHELLEHDLLLGGEPSGHIIMRDYLNSADAIFTALRVLELVSSTKQWHLDTFTPYPQLLTNIQVDTKYDLANEPFASIIQTFRAQLPQGRIIVRYSGTENLLRIMVEDADEKQVHTISTQLTYALTDAYKGLSL